MNRAYLHVFMSCIHLLLTTLNDPSSSQNGPGLRAAERGQAGPRRRPGALPRSAARPSEAEPKRKRGVCRASGALV